jgi:hypothetical protein
VHQIVTSPDAIDASPGSSNGQVVDPDATPLSSAPDPFIADDTPDPVVVDNVPPPLPPLPEHQQDQSLDHLANLS